jgi:hypothetical protein
VIFFKKLAKLVEFTLEKQKFPIFVVKKITACDQAIAGEGEGVVKP